MTSKYVLILVWIGIAAVIFSQEGMQQPENICGKTEYSYRFLWAFLVFLPVIWMVGNRGNIGDTGSYEMEFKKMAHTISGIASYMSTVKKDKGFYLLSSIIKIIVGNSTVRYFLMLALGQGLCLIYVFRKYSSNYAISIFLFLASSDYISWMYNGIRQFTAVVLCFIGIEFLLNNKTTKFVLLILIASTMHQSALILIPFAIIAKGRAWNKKTIFFILAALVVVVFIGRFTNILDTALSDTQYKNVVSDWKEFQDNGTNPLRVLVYAVPTILSYIGRKIIWIEDNKLINLCVNMSIISTGLYAVSMFTSGIFIGRLPIYFSLYNYILLPWEIENLFTERSKKLVCIGLIGFYLLFYYYQMHMTYAMF